MPSWTAPWLEPHPQLARLGLTATDRALPARCRPQRSTRHCAITAFATTRWRIDGLVENPVVLSYDELKAMLKKEQITQHYCIQGWSGVAKWGGVPMRDILELVRPLPQARCQQRRRDHLARHSTVADAS